VSLFGELKRRNVFRVAVAYAIIAWLTAQIVDLVLDNIEAPSWIIQVLFLLLAVGFVVAVIFSWAFEVTPEGVKLERDVIRDESITHLTARKLDYVTVAAALVVAGMFGWQQYATEPLARNTRSISTESIGDSVVDVARLGAYSIAVLPFANRSNQEEDVFFTDGIHDDLLTQLAKIDNLKVISRTSVMEYRDTTKKIPEIASELGVAKVLEGGVQRAGQRIRINAQLINVATDEHLWAETYDREMTIDNLFDIQSEITRQIVAAVKGQMSTRDEGALATAPTESVAAYEAYLRARQVLGASGYNMEKYQEAQPMLERAIDLDPDFALAHLRLAEIHSYAIWIGWDTSAARQIDAKAAIDHAAAILGADAPEIQAARGNYLYRFERDFEGALAAETAALAAMPGDVILLTALGSTQRRLGLWSESIASFLLADELDPASPEAASLAAATMRFSNELDRLESFLADARQRFPYDTDLASTHAMLPIWANGDTITARQRYDAIRPNSGLEYVNASTFLPMYERDFVAAIEAWDLPDVRPLVSLAGWRGWPEVNQAIAWRALGEDERADTLLKSAIEREIDYSIRPFALASELSARAWALVLFGENELAIATAEEAVELVTYEEDKLEGLTTVWNQCFVLARAGRRDEALACLPKVIDQPGGPLRWELYLDPTWDFMRDDERFNELIRPDNFEQSIHAKNDRSR